MRIKHLLQTSLVAAVINIALTPIAPGVAAYFGYLMIICFWAYALVWTFQNRSMRISILLLLAIVALSAVTSTMYFNGEELRKKIISLVSFISFYWILSLPADTDSQQNIEFKHLYYSAVVLTFVFVTYAFAFPAIAYTPYGAYGNLIFTMGLGNPNGTAVYVLFTAMVLLLAFVSTKRKLKKIMLMILVCVLSYIMYLLSSRTVLICFLLAVVCVIVLPKLKVKRIFRYAVLIAPLIMILIQFAFNDKIGDLEILGKDLDTGRFEMYRDLLQEITKNPVQYIFGNLCGYNFQNFHNGILTIFASLGVVGVAWALNTWNNKLKRIEKGIKNHYQQLAYFFVLLLLFDSIAESMTMVGTIPQGLFVCLMVKVAQGDIVLKLESATK